MNRIINVVGVALLSVAMFGCGQKKDEQKVDKNREELVKVQKMEKRTISRESEFSTNLQGYETMNVSPSMSGKIEKILVDVGSKVGRGQLLVQMDQTQYNSAKLNYTNLKIELARVEALLKTGSVSQQTYDQTKLQFDQVNENLAFLEKNTFVKADFAGVISAKNYESGELFAGQPIVVLTQLNTLKAIINIPESYFPLVKAGMDVDIYTDIYPEEVFKSKIEIVYPTIDAGTHTFQAKLKIPNAKEILRPGMYVKTTMGLGEAEAIIVPYQSVLKLQGSNDRYVFLNKNGVAKRVSVLLGQRFDDKIEIISEEIKEGDELVVVGQARLVDGVKLKIDNK